MYRYSLGSCAHAVVHNDWVTCRVDRDGWGLCRFDGDGMLHAVRIKDGKAAYSNAYVQTSRFKQERKAGRPLIFRVSTSSFTPEHPQPCLHLAG